MYTVSWDEVAVGQTGVVACSVRVQRDQHEPWLNFWERACTEWDAGRRLVSLSLSACSQWTYAGRVTQLALACLPGRWQASWWLCWPWAVSEIHYAMQRPVGEKEWIAKARLKVSIAHSIALEKWVAERQLGLPGL